MATSGFNWQILVGFLVAVFALISYPTIFVQWPATRDFPWANLVLFGIAAVLVAVGAKRAFGAGRGLISKMLAAALGALTVLVFSGFIFMAFVAGRMLPAAAAAPTLNSKAPVFSIGDSDNKPVTLSDLISKPIETQNGPVETRAALLIFYRGYW